MATYKLGFYPFLNFNSIYLRLNQMIVTTPEKWDVITRKSSDMSLSMLVKLLIIDEVHLLNDDRGPVIEALVARTLRQVQFLTNDLYEFVLTLCRRSFYLADDA